MEDNSRHLVMADLLEYPRINFFQESKFGLTVNAFFANNKDEEIEKTQVIAYKTKNGNKNNINFIKKKVEDIKNSLKDISFIVRKKKWKLQNMSVEIDTFDVSEDKKRIINKQNLYTKEYKV
jgi:DNA-directed RNA polymerase alpha subunit